MHWHMRGLRKISITITILSMLLILMVWMPMSAASAYEGTSGQAQPVTVQATPTVNPTIAAETANEQLRKF